MPRNAPRHFKIASNLQETFRRWTQYAYEGRMVPVEWKPKYEGWARARKIYEHVNQELIAINEELANKGAGFKVTAELDDDLCEGILSVYARPTTYSAWNIYGGSCGKKIDIAVFISEYYSLDDPASLSAQEFNEACPLTADQVVETIKRHVEYVGATIFPDSPLYDPLRVPKIQTGKPAPAR